jgi:hypothetical protein
MFTAGSFGFKSKKMAKNRDRRVRAENHDRFWTGMILLIVGGGLLVQKMGLDLPYWLFTWQTLLIVIGLVIGLKHGFRNPTWLIMVGIGGFFLMDDIITDINFKPYFWPVMIIGLGLVFMLRPKRRWHVEHDKWDDDHVITPTTDKPKDRGCGDSNIFGFSNRPGGQNAASMDETIESVSIFGGVKKVVTSKNFRGGDIVCFMGGAEINLSQADIQGPATVEIVQGFGGTKLIIPPHWEIRSEAVAIFGAVEDKRPPHPGSFDPNKVLVIRGTTIFGGIEIKSY